MKKAITMKEVQIQWPRLSGGKALTAEAEKGTPKEMTSERQPAEGGAGRVAGAQGGAEPVATRPCSESRVPSQAQQLAQLRVWDFSIR